MQDQLFIAKIPTNFTNDDLIALFENVGAVKKLHRPVRRGNNQPETYAFITMETPELAQEAIARLNGYVLSEGLAPLVVKVAEPPASSVPTPASQPAPEHQLFVAKVPPDFPNDQLLALFESVGEVKNFQRKLRAKIGQLETYGFVTMATAEGAAQALERLDGYSFGADLPPLVVKVAEPRTANNPDNLFVTRIPSDFPTEELAGMFEAVGLIKQFHRPVKRETGQPETYAFVRMATPQLAREALERLNGFTFGDGLLPMVVKFAEERAEQPKPAAPTVNPAHLFVAPLPVDFPSEQLAEMFESVGSVIDFQRPFKLRTGEQAKFAFVTMATPELAQEAIARLKGYSFGERHAPLDVRVSKSVQQKPGDKTPPTPTREETEELDQAAIELADLLGETETMPRLLIKQILYRCGIDQVRVWYQQTMAIEEQGGMLMEKLGRRRTPGGVFFFIAKKSMSNDLINSLFPREAAWRRRRTERAAQMENRASAPPAEPVDDYPPFEWEQRTEALDELFEDSGNTLSVKVVVVGRPDTVNIDSNQVTLTVRRNFQLSHVPKGVPRPPVFATTTTIYVPLKMWNKVEQALQNPEDRLVVEGFAAIESGKEGYSVYGTLVTTALLQRERFAKSDSPQE